MGATPQGAILATSMFHVGAIAAASPALPSSAVSASNGS
jgi:hypothetical protein